MRPLLGVPVVLLLLPSVALAQSIAWVSQFGTPKSDLVWGVAVQGTDVYVDGSTFGTFMRVASS